MDQEILEDEQIEEGLALITKLVSKGCDVMVAFWAKMSDGGMWYLYIVLKSHDTAVAS